LSAPISSYASAPFITQNDKTKAIDVPVGRGNAAAAAPRAGRQRGAAHRLCSPVRQAGSARSPPARPPVSPQKPDKLKSNFLHLSEISEK
jgi:hypothetical protein